jgi:opacity protein-like surface antigen
LGWVGWNNLMFYGTGGVAWANVKYDALEGHYPPTFFTNYISTTSSTQTQTGWVAGGGVEYMLSAHVSARAEYLYYGLNNRNHSASANLFPNPGAFPLPFQYAWSNANIQVVRFGFDYTF